MKKLLVLAAFLGLGYVGVNAQTVAPKKEAPKAQVVRNEVKPENTTPVVMEDALPGEKVAEKKHCAPSDKKECGTSTNKKKSCCSTKKEATTTPAPQN
jgi:hypothetical protein